MWTDRSARKIWFCLVCSMSIVFLVAISASAQGTAPPAEDKATLDCVDKGHEALQKKDLDGAVTAFAGCVEKFPKSVLARFWLGMALFYNKQAPKAADQFKEILKLDPNNIDASGMLGRIYSFDKEKLAVAEELLEKAIRVKPDSTDVRFDLARVYALGGKLEKSFGEFAILFDTEGKFPLFRTEFAKILIAGDAKDEAKMQLQRALVLDPDFEPAKQLLKQLGSGAAGGAAAKPSPK